MESIIRLCNASRLSLVHKLLKIDKIASVNLYFFFYSRSKIEIRIVVFFFFSFERSYLLGIYAD